jgi:uncharacterized protein YciI
MKKILLLGVFLLASPQLSGEEQANYFLLRYLPGDNWVQNISYAKQPGLKAHHDYLRRLHINDQVVMGGTTLDTVGSMMLVRSTSLEQVRTLVEFDPGVRTRIVSVELIPWDVTMSSMRPVRRKAEASSAEPGQSYRLKRIDLDSRLNIEKQ